MLNDAIFRLLGDNPQERFVPQHTRGRNVLVVFSGGQDSATCLALARASRLSGAQVHTITFDYGQRHAAELECAQWWSYPGKVVDMKFIGELAPSALTRGLDDVSAQHPLLPGRPASFVPNRNAFFLTAAHAYALAIGAEEIWTGVCETDYSGYPDCRSEFIGKLQNALTAGAEKHIPIRTPLMNINKAQTWALAAMVGAVQDIVDHTHTCYNGNHVDLHAWGYGCDNCPSCELRRKGFETYIKAGMEH